MLVISKAPIVEEHSNLTSEERKNRRKTRTNRAGETLKKGYSRAKEAGALPVIENLLGLNYAPSADLASSTPVVGDTPILPPADEVKSSGMSKTTKWVIGISVVAVVGVLGYYLWKNSKGKMLGAPIKKA